MTSRSWIAQILAGFLLAQGVVSTDSAHAEHAAHANPEPEIVAWSDRPTVLEVVPEARRWRPTPEAVRAVIDEAASVGFEIGPDAVHKAARYLHNDSDSESRIRAAVIVSTLLSSMAIGIGMELAALFFETWLGGQLVPACENVIEAMLIGAIFGAVGALRLLQPLPNVARVLLDGLESNVSTQIGISKLLAEAVPEHLLFGPVCDRIAVWRWDDMAAGDVTDEVVDQVWDRYGDAFVEAASAPQSEGSLAGVAVRSEDASGAVNSLFETVDTVHWVAELVVRDAGTYDLELRVANQGQEFSIANHSLTVSAGELAVPARWTGSVSAATLLGLDGGPDDAFVLNVRVTKGAEFADVDSEQRPVVLVRSPPNEAPVLVFDTEIVTNVLTVEGKYFDADGDPPSELSVSISGQEHDLLPSTGQTGVGVYAFADTFTLDDGIHPTFVRYSDGVAPVATSAIRQVRASATPPVVDLVLATDTMTLGEALPFTVSMSDALGTIPNRDIQLARDGRGGFLDAAGEAAFVLSTDASGVATGTYLPASPGLRTLLARDRVSHRLDFETVDVEANDPQDWRCVLNWTLLSTSEDEATYRSDVVITFQGDFLDVGDRVFFSANHGTFRDEDDGVGASGQATNEYTLTAAEAASGDEVITIRVPEWNVAFTKVTNLPVGQPASFEVFRTLNIRTFPGENETLSVAMSRDGRFLGSIHDRRIIIRELPGLGTFRDIDIDPLGADEMTSIDFSPDGSHVVAGDEDGNLIVADIDAGTAFLRSRTNGSADIMGVSWYAPNRIAAVTEDGNTANPYRPRAIILDAALSPRREVFFDDYQVGSVIDRVKCVETNSLCAVSSQLPPTSWYLFNATSGTIIEHGTHPDPNPLFAVALSRRGDRFAVGGADDNGGTYLELFSTTASSATALGQVLTTNTDVFGLAFFDDEFGNRRLLVNGNSAAEEFDQNGGGILRSAPRLHLSDDSFHIVHLDEKGVVAGLDRNRQSLINVSGDVFPPDLSLFDTFEVPFSQTSLTLTGELTDPSGVWTREYRRDGGDWMPLALDAAGDFAIAVDALPVGETLIEIRAADYFVNEGTYEARIVRLDDTEGPVLVNWRIDPESGDPGTVFDLSVEAFDTDSGVASVEATVRSAGSAVANCTLLPTVGDTYACAIDSTSLPIGILVIDLTATDTSPNANVRTLEGVISFEVTAIEVIFEDGFESGDTAAWSP